MSRGWPGPSGDLAGGPAASILSEALPEGRQDLPGRLDGPYVTRILRSVILRLLDSPHGRGDARREGVEVVAALQDERRGRRPHLAGQGGEPGGEAPEGRGLQRHASQRVVPVGVVTGGDQDQGRTELAHYGEEDPGERRRVSFFPRTRGEGHVHGEAPSPALPHLVGPAGPGIEGALVGREVEDLPVVVEDVLGTVAVVYVPVEDGYSLDPARTGVFGGYRDVVEQTEPHPGHPPGVVAGRARDRERRLPRKGALDGRDGGSARQGGHLPGMRVERRVQAEVALTLGGEVLQMIQVRTGVNPLENVLLRGLAGAPLHRHAAPLCLLGTGERRRKPLRGLHAGQVVDVPLRGGVAVNAQACLPSLRPPPDPLSGSGPTPGKSGLSYLDAGLSGTSIVEYLFDLARGAGDDLPDPAHLLPVQPSRVHLAPEELGEARQIVLHLVQLGRDLRVPASADPAPDVLDGPPVLFEELPSLVGYLVDLLAVLLR